MPTSFYIFLVASFIALVPACFDHGETWGEIKLGDKKNRCQNVIKLLALWAIPILTIVGTIYLGIESVVSDRQEKQHEIDLRSAHNEISGLSNQLAEATKPKPFKERLIACLNGIDARIIPDLKAGHTKFSDTLKPYQFTDLEKLAAEPEASAYISFSGAAPNGWLLMGADGSHSASFVLNPSLLK